MIFLIKKSKVQEIRKPKFKQFLNGCTYEILRDVLGLWYLTTDIILDISIKININQVSYISK